ncbi:MAG: L-seryl-tRNA(Sec) selenium transferase [SAR324 cluster bacterium]|nr:L-seryl-tRNA(Sec) selenium transferase [SAR324 cluster bacterium]
MEKIQLYSRIPSISEVDHWLRTNKLPFGKRVRSEVQAILSELRMKIQNIEEESAFQYENKQEILDHILIRFIGKQHEKTSNVINATGIVVHTNLGRSPLSLEILTPLLKQWSCYTPLEYNLATGTRGERGHKIIEYLKLLSGAPEALVVNNNASAVFLMLFALAKGKEVIVSRGELVEIGGSFRIPDIMRAADVKLIEVGTTNRTRLSDYENAISENTVGFLKVHPSNYVIHGFVEEVSTGALAELASKHDLKTFYDLGSGTFYQFKQPQLASIQTIQQEWNEGVDILSFSGDKLLGSVQAGIVLGKTDLITKLRKNPLYRAFRLDKITLSILESTLISYLEMKDYPEHNLTIQLLEQPIDVIEKRAIKVLKSLDGCLGPGWKINLIETLSLTGGGALPELYLRSYGLLVEHPDKSANIIQKLLRESSIPIITRIENKCVILDFRTVFDEDCESVSKNLQLLCS